MWLFLILSFIFQVVFPFVLLWVEGVVSVVCLLPFLFSVFYLMLMFPACCQNLVFVSSTVHYLLEKLFLDARSMLCWSDRES